MSESKRKNKTRTVGVNFPHDEQGDYLHAALRLLMQQEDRSASRVSYRIIKDYFDSMDDSFRDDVLDMMQREKDAEEVDDTSGGFDLG